MPDGFVMAPVIKQSGSYDTNPLLLLSGAQTLYGSTTAPELIISDSTPTARLKSDTQVDENIFNIKSFNSTDVHSTNSLDIKHTLWGYGIGGQLDYDTTRTSEISAFGFPTSTVRHTGLSATPRLSYTPSAIDRFDLTANAQSSTYASSRYTNYTVFSLTPSYAREINPLNTAIINLSARRYSTQNTPRTITDTFGSSIGWRATLTPKLSADALIGGQVTRQKQSGSPATPLSAQLTFSGDATYKGEQDQTVLSATRSSTPFANGTDSLLTNFSLTETHELNTSFSVNAAASYEFAEYPQTATNSLQSLASGSGGIAYHITEHVDMTGTYQYRRESLVGISQKVDDHSVVFGFTYHPQAWTL